MCLFILDLCRIFTVPALRLRSSKLGFGRPEADDIAVDIIEAAEGDRENVHDPTNPEKAGGQRPDDARADFPDIVAVHSEDAEVMGWPFRVHICASTVYNYIRWEIFGNDLSPEMLPQHGKRRRKPERPDGTIPRKPAGKSIEKRPKHINDRLQFGHWEMDSLESCKGARQTWLMLTERKTRWELIVSMRDKTSASVIRALNGIERRLGAMFPKIFLSITCDNGTEFSDAEGIENKRRGKGKRTEVYYCHPYTPSERGTNENQNGLIRRLVPKGTDLGTLSPQEVKAAEAWLNHYPRKMFGYLCAEQLFQEEIALILAR